jgi:hypothetical protein
MNCDAGSPRTFSVSSPSCGLSASTQVTCGNCDGI